MGTLKSQAYGDFLEAPTGGISVDAGFVNGRNLLGDKWDLTDNIVGTALAQVSDIKTEYGTFLGDILQATEQQAALKSYTISNVEAIDAGTKPVLDDFEITDQFPDNLPYLQALDPVPDLDTSYTKPVKPSEINPTVNYRQSDYSQENYLLLFSAIQTGIASGTGIPDEIEDLLLIRHQERNQPINDAAINKTLTAAGQTGRSYPEQYVTSLMAEHSNTVLRQDRVANNEIAIVRMEMEQRYKQFIIGSSVSLEQLLINHFNNQENRTLEAEKATAQLAVDLFAQNIKAYIEGDWGGIIADMETKEKALNVALTKRKIHLETYKEENSAFKTHVEAVASKIGAKTDVRKADVDAHKAEVISWSEYHKNLTDRQRAVLQKDELEVRRLTSILLAAVEENGGINSLKKEILSVVENVWSQALAAALNATHVSLGHSTSSNESVSEGTHISASLNESHTFDETATD